MKSRFFALPCAYYEEVQLNRLNSTDRKVLFAIIWFTLGWTRPTNIIPLKSLRRFANVSEKALYQSRKRLVAFKLVAIQEQRAERNERGARRQGHTAYTMMLKPKPYVKIPYDLAETFAPQLSGPELLLWLVILRKGDNGAFWFATLSQLRELTGYGQTAVKKARSGLLARGLIDGCRGVSAPLAVAGYRALSSPRQVGSRRWEYLPRNNLWDHLQKQQLRHTGSSVLPAFSSNEAAFLNNVYEQLPHDFVVAADSLTCRLADQGRLDLYERKLLAVANNLARRLRVHLAA